MEEGRVEDDGCFVGVGVTSGVTSGVGGGVTSGVGGVGVGVGAGVFIVSINIHQQIVWRLHHGIAGFGIDGIILCKKRREE